MRQYFEQFGDIAHLRISRNKRGRSRHYGFIEFVAQDVAEIVVETMHNYMLDGRLLQCKLIPLERRNPQTFDNESKPKPRATAPIERQRKIRNQNQSMQVYLTRAEGLVKSENKKRQQLKELKIDYEFPGYAASKLQWEPKFKAKLEQEVKAKEALEKAAEKKKNDKVKASEQSQPAKVTVS
ncbi:hypothetical protein BCR42DRAFT_123436 [Absidia repens]|uniref:RRM domain-containing protein n=1 Tax=Absidia repens TaxID=90262 RepID=A0A1X2I4N7_9FUNG|nr:hypothetical protein BCR42DRAFT_123436 [Absidia repens]